MLSAERLGADLLSSMPLCFNFWVGGLDGAAVTRSTLSGNTTSLSEASGQHIRN